MAGKFINIYFGPWQMRKTSIRKNEVVSLFNHPRGYKHGDIKWQKYEWTAMKDNAKSFGFPFNGYSSHNFAKYRLKRITNS